MSRGQLTSLVGITLLAAAGLAFTFAAGNEPLLGLDLQGGVSVVLQPTEDVDDDTLDEAVEIMRRRVDALGVAEPEISRQGSNILVSIPGIDDQERAIELVGQTAELRFRPVVQDMGFVPVSEEGQDALEELQSTTTTTPIDGSTTTTADGAGPTSSSPAAPTTEAGDSSTTTIGAPSTATTTLAPAGTTTTVVERAVVRGRAAQPFAQTGTSTTAPATETTTTVAASTTTAEPGAPSTTTPAATTTVPDTGPGLPSTTSIAPIEPADIVADPNAEIGSAERCLATFADRGADGVTIRSDDGFAETNEFGFTDPENDLVCDTVILPDQNEQGGLAQAVMLGPTAFTGTVVDDAQARLQTGQWSVAVDLRGGDAGADLFDELALACVSQGASCPSGRIGIALDGIVQSSPTVQTTEFDGQVQITGAFSEREAKDLALVLRFGALPVELEIQNTEQVSATIGEDSLNAGIVAGLVGLAVVAVYILAYYRLLGVIAMASLAVSGALLWTIISWLGETQGLALSLAGVTGLIVSIGVSVDSNIVYFEHLREDVRNGRTPRSAVDRAFPVAFSTIFWADGASLIGAVVLYVLTVGGVRGFAFYLGLSVILDLVATYFFMRPAVKALTRSKSFDDNPGRFGIPAATVADGPVVTS